MRHLGAGLAIPDIPLVFGHWLPPLTSTQMDTANRVRNWTYHLDRVTLGQIWLAYTHRIGAVAVTTAIASLVAMIVRSRRVLNDLLAPAGVLVVLLLTQITLGLLTVYFRKPADVASAHVACGALVLVTAFVIASRAVRLRFVSGMSVPLRVRREATDAASNSDSRYDRFPPALVRETVSS